MLSTLRLTLTQLLLLLKKDFHKYLFPFPSPELTMVMSAIIELTVPTPALTREQTHGARIRLPNSGAHVDGEESSPKDLQSFPSASFSYFSIQKIYFIVLICKYDFFNSLTVLFQMNSFPKDSPYMGHAREDPLHLVFSWTKNHRLPASLVRTLLILAGIEVNPGTPKWP